jgi:hypothetical protein
MPIDIYLSILYSIWKSYVIPCQFVVQGFSKDVSSDLAAFGSSEQKREEGSLTVFQNRCKCVHGSHYLHRSDGLLILIDREAKT